MKWEIGMSAIECDYVNIDFCWFCSVDMLEKVSEVSASSCFLLFIYFDDFPFSFYSSPVIYMFS